MPRRGKHDRSATDAQRDKGSTLSPVAAPYQKEGGLANVQIPFMYSKLTASQTFEKFPLVPSQLSFELTYPIY